MNTINGRTPDEIKKALELCADGECDGCNYLDRHTACEYLYKLTADAFGYIQQLESDLEQAEQVNAGLEIMLTSAQSAAETWKRKRDAAVDDLKGRCFSCANAKPHEKYQNLIVCPHIKSAVGGNGKRDCAFWQYRDEGGCV